MTMTPSMADAPRSWGIEALKRWRRACSSLDIVDKTDSPFAMPYENGRPIFICRNSRLSLAKLWDRLKRYR